MTKDKELLPCPFCGSGNTEIANIFYLKAIRGQCADCGASAPIEAWNARATPDLPQHTGLCPLCDQRAKDGANMDGKHCVRHKRPDFDCGAISCFDCMRITTEARKQATMEDE